MKCAICHNTARGSEFSGLHCPLAGEHQVENAIAAALALESLGVSPKGIAERAWPGRLEHVSPNPGHSFSTGRIIRRARERWRGIWNGFMRTGRIWMIYGAMRDKAVDEIAGILFPLASELVFTAPDNARALRPEALRELAGRGFVAPDIGAAVQEVRKHVGEDDVVVITGSLFLVGEARALSYNRHSWPFSGAWSS